MIAETEGDTDNWVGAVGVGGGGWYFGLQKSSVGKKQLIINNKNINQSPNFRLL